LDLAIQAEHFSDISGGEYMSIIELKELKFDSESEFESILTENPNLIEEGLKIVDTQVITNRGRLDILGLDSGKVLVIIELKIVESDEMLWQALDYYDWVFRNIDSIKRMYPNNEIDYNQPPRLMLIAPSFSDAIKRRAIYLDPSVELLEYKYLQAADKKGMLLIPVSLPTVDGISGGRPPIETLVNYITNEQSREICKNVIEQIRTIGNNIQVLSRKYHISFYVSGSRFAALSPRREYFWIDTYINEEWKATKIEAIKDFESIFENIKESFQKVGGILALQEKKTDLEAEEVSSEIEEEK
jgi:RecB family endonuclease NucS